MAMARPPSVMVLSVTPNLSSRMMAVSSESGMAVMEMNAVRKWPRNRNSTTATRMPPSVKRMFDVVQRVFDERGGPVQARIKL